jgi:hypothetical protein
MSKLSDLKKELRYLRKKHCPPTGKMKKDDVQKEIERLRGVEKVTEYEAHEYLPGKWLVYHKKSDILLFTQDQVLHAVQRVLFQ